MVIKLRSTSHGLDIIRTCYFRQLLLAFLYFCMVSLHCLLMCQGMFSTSNTTHYTNLHTDTLTITFR